MNEHGRSDARETAGVIAHLADLLARWTDREWLLFVGVLFLPALLCLLLGNTLRASFFAGLAIYLGVLKWLGWLLFTRYAGRSCAYVLFPAEIFVGLALACFWLYLRNLIGQIWPASYGLFELVIFSWIVIAMNLLGGLIRFGQWYRSPSRSAKGWPSDLFQRLAMYVPYIFILFVIFWQVSGVLHVQTTDSIVHAFSARVYRNSGIFFRLCPETNGGWPIAYPSGFGAINAVTAAISPLNIAQAVNIQHILLLITGLFLITGSIATLAGRPLWLLHGLLLPLLGLFPIHGLYPYLNYEGPGRQTAPAFLIAICLLPVISTSTRLLPYCLLVGVEAMLIVLTAVLNPACAIPAALAAFVALLVNCYRGKRLLSLSYLRLLCLQAGLLVFTLAVVLGCDEYYKPILRSKTPSQAVTEQIEGKQPSTVQESEEQAFSLSRALQGVGSTHPGQFTSDITVAPIYDKWELYRDWQHKSPFKLFPWLALMAVVLVVAVVIARRQDSKFLSELKPLLLILAGCFLLWFVVQYVTAFLTHGLSFSVFQTALLSSYLTLLASRCELILIFTTLLTGIAILYLVAERSLRSAPAWRVVTAVLIVPLIGFPYLSVFLPTPSSGYLTARDAHFRGPITENDVKLVAWVDRHISPEEGLVGLAAETDRLGQDKHEQHIYPTGGAKAMLFYSKHYNFCFTQLDPNLPFPFDDYNAHVKNTLDAQWCLDNNIRYFFIPVGGLRFNPGLDAAIKDGKLKLVQSEDDQGGIYKIVNPDAP